MSVGLAVFMLLFARPLAVLLQAPEEALDLTVLYVRICGGGIAANITYFIILDRKMKNLPGRHIV